MRHANRLFLHIKSSRVKSSPFKTPSIRVLLAKLPLVNISQWQGLALLGVISLLTACSGIAPLPSASPKQPFTTDPAQYQYLIGPGDGLSIFVWRNPDVSSSVTVRPDGRITTPLVEDVMAANKTPTQLARDLEKAIGAYIKDPIVTVTATGFVGPYSEQVRVVGEAAKPQSLSYRQNMTLLDVMIAVGGLTEFADGNDALVVRIVGGEQKQFSVRLEDLVRDGDITANAELLPGDIIIIPEAFF